MKVIFFVTDNHCYLVFYKFHMYVFFKKMHYFFLVISKTKFSFFFLYSYEVLFFGSYYILITVCFIICDCKLIFFIIPVNYYFSLNICCCLFSSDGKLLEESTSSICKGVAINNCKSGNFGALIRNFLVRATELKASVQCEE